MELFLFSTIFLLTSAANCPRPAVSSHHSLDFPGLEGSEKDGSIFWQGVRAVFRCHYNGLESTLICKNGSWEGELDYCFSDAAEGKTAVNLKTNKTYHLHSKGKCAPAGEYEIALVGTFHISLVNITVSADDIEKAKKNPPTVMFALISRTNGTEKQQRCFSRLDSELTEIKDLTKACSMENVTHIFVRTTADLCEVQALTSKTIIPEQFGKEIQNFGVFFGGKYVTPRLATNYKTAINECKKIGGKLLDSWTENELDYISRQKIPFSSHYWIVCNYGWFSRRWIYEDGKPLNVSEVSWMREGDAKPKAGEAGLLALNSKKIQSENKTKFHKYICVLESLPRCLGKMAGSPAGGRVVSLTENRVQFKCDPGFVMFGRAERHCGADGFWKGEMPKCLEEEKEISTTAISQEE